MRYIKTFEHYETDFGNWNDLDNLKNQLNEKLLKFGGERVAFRSDIPYELTRMINDGHLFDISGRKLMKGRVNKCHANVAELYEINKGKVKIVSGYVLLDDVWIQHSWLVSARNGTIIETTYKFDKYFGYEYTEDESEEFCSENY